MLYLTTQHEIIRRITTVLVKYWWYVSGDRTIWNHLNKFNFFVWILWNHLKISKRFIYSLEPSENIKRFNNSLEPSKYIRICYLFLGTISYYKNFLILWNHLNKLNFFINSLKPSKNMNTFYTFSGTIWKCQYFLSILWNHLKI